MQTSKHLLHVRNHALTLVAAASLAACGGGSSNDDAAAAAASEESPTAQAQAVTTTTTWQRVAMENQTFTLAAATQVRFGTGTSWVTKTLSGTVTCSNKTFGKDPAVGSYKQCDIPVTTTTDTSISWQKVAAENQAFTLTAATTVRYGAGSTWITKTLSGTVNCSNGVFGSDPAVGVYKQCEIPNTSTSTPTTGGGTTTPTTPTTGTSGTTITAKLTPTRTTGVAPLAVLFDATDTVSTVSTTDTFRQVKYSFDFGDERGQTWATSGLPKNTETSGPVAAHVFEVPGTYTVKLRATDTNGSTSDVAVTITVLDPAAAYASTKTVCVSNVGDYAGCPAGATQQKTLPTGTGWNGKRVLLKRGETFGSISILDGNVGVIVDGYGTGNAPKVASIGVGNWRPSTTTFASDITIANLAVLNGFQHSVGSRVLLLRNDFTTPGQTNSIYFGGLKYWAIDDPWRQVPTAAFYNPREIFLVENKVTGSTSGDGYNVYGDGSRLALLGNVMGTSMYHTVRLTAAHKAVLAHNELRGISSAGLYHSLKLHSGGLGAFTDDFATSSNTWASDKVVVANNLFGNANDNNQWTVAICPENDVYPEGVQNVLIQSNRFVRGKGTFQDLTMGGRKFTQRGNTVTSGAALTTGLGHTGGLPSDWQGPYYTN